MTYDLQLSIELLSRTPMVLKSLLSGLSNRWIMNNEGENTWSPYDVVGHLIHLEKTNWMNRVLLILSNDQNKTFNPINRFAQMNWEQQISIEELLSDFKELRAANLKDLRALQLDDADLLKSGFHPEFGEVKLKQLLATWVAHDLDHIYQICRVMAKQYDSEVGPWMDYLKILKQ